jgi:hypothetical protein
MCLWNIGWLSVNYTVVYLGKESSSRLLLFVCYCTHAQICKWQTKITRGARIGAWLGHRLMGLRFFIVSFRPVLEVVPRIGHYPWQNSVSPSKLHWLSDCRLSVKLVPSFADRVCHVVSMMDTYSHIPRFLDQSCYLFFQIAPQLYSRDWVDSVPDPLLRKSGSSRPLDL